MVAVVTLASGAARVDVVPSLGGAVAAFQWRGHDVMRHTPAQVVADRNVRLCASFPLVPFSNRIEDAQLRFAGATFALDRNYPDHPHAIHGVGFQRPWQVVAQHADRVTLDFDYRPAEDDRRGWPFGFRARQSLAVCELGGQRGADHVARRREHRCARLPVRARLASLLPACCKHTSCRSRPTACGRRDRRCCPCGTSPSRRRCRFDPPRAIGGTTMDNVFTGVRGAARLDYPDRGLRVSVEGDRATPFLVVFIPPGRDFCALEPVTHMTDAFNRHARGEAGTGTRTLAPGAGFSCTMRILAQPLGDGHG